MGRGSAIELPGPGDRLSEKYELVRVIGEGGMARVFEAKHVRIGQRVAIKMLLPAMLALPEIVTRFAREARAAGSLQSRHTARVIDVDECNGLPYMVMDFLVGRDLDAELTERGRFAIDEAVGYVLQACSAMIEAHEHGIVHRDLKPSNLFLCEDETDPGGERVLKVLDFGISKMDIDGDSSVTATQATIGTPLYMSPEQVRSAKNVDVRTDIWSLGVILYELLAGQPPFNGASAAVIAAIVADTVPPLRGLRAEVPAELDAAIARALEKKPADRFPDVSALAAALAPFGSPGRTSERFLAVRRASSPNLAAVRIPPPAFEVSEQDGALAATQPDSKKNLDAGLAPTMPDSRPNLAESGTPDDSSRDVGKNAAGVTAPGWATSTSRSGRTRRMVTALGAAGVALAAVSTVTFFATRTPPSAAHALDLPPSVPLSSPPPSALASSSPTPPAPVASTTVAGASAAPSIGSVAELSSSPLRSTADTPKAVKGAVAKPVVSAPIVRAATPTSAPPAATKNPDKL
jgi:serine/threonine-protein kinase